LGYAKLLEAAVEAAGLSPGEVVLPEDREVELGGLRFHYLDWGNAHLPHVVLLHGGSLTAHTWDLAALLLRDRYHLVALDQRGHGDSDWTPAERLHEDAGEHMLEDTRLFIESLGFERLSLVGMSMGGINSIRYAARHPGRLDALGIVDVAPETMREGQVEMEAFRAATETLRDFEDFVERAVRFMPHRPVAHLRYSLTHSLRRTEDGDYTWKRDRRPRPPRDENADAAANRARADALWDDVRAIRTPTLLFRGADSKILSPEVADETVKAMHDARLALIPRATHNVHSDNPGDFADALDAFLSAKLPA
jgi:pimeloyl-ACP methyl ester carboxylesterase